MPRSREIAELIAELSLRGDEEGINQTLAYLKEYKLEALLPLIEEHLVRIQKTRGDEHSLLITSRYELSAQQLDGIRNLIGVSEEVPVVMTQDPSLIGSWKAAYKGKLYDGSVSSAVRSMRHTLTSY